MRISQMLMDGKAVEAYWESGKNEMYEGHWSNHTAAMTQHGSGTHIGVLKAQVANNNITITGDLAAELINVSIPDQDVGNSTEYRIAIHSDLGDGEILLNA